MLDWESASTAVKATLLGAIGLFALGLILAFTGVSTGNRPLMFVAIGLLALGVLTHLTGFAIRMRQARADLKRRSAAAGTPQSRGAGRTARKGRR